MAAVKVAVAEAEALVAAAAIKTMGRAVDDDAVGAGPDVTKAATRSRLRTATYRANPAKDC